jgi:hypothetical protein
MRKKDITGIRFGKLIPIKPVYRKWNKIIWECLCDCGKKTFLSVGQLSSGRTISCGCSKESYIKTPRNKTHGLYHSPLYIVWKGMKARCLNPKDPRYSRYGGRGIKICLKWIDFKGFYEDMFPGYEKELQIDRVDNNGNYCKENCRWTTAKINCNNRYY